MVCVLCDARLVLNAVKKLPKEVIAGFYTIEARNPKTGEKIGLDIGEWIFLLRGSKNPTKVQSMLFIVDLSSYSMLLLHDHILCIFIVCLQWLNQLYLWRSLYFAMSAY